MTTIFSFLIGAGAGLWLGLEMHRRVRAERNLARLQRDVAEADRDKALLGQFLVFDPVKRAMMQHPSSKNISGQR